MGEIDKRGNYINEIPFDDAPYIKGKVIVESNHRELNNYIESRVRLLLRDIYYGRCEDFEL